MATVAESKHKPAREQGRYSLEGDVHGCSRFSPELTRGLAIMTFRPCSRVGLDCDFSPVLTRGVVFPWEADLLITNLYIFFGTALTRGRVKSVSFK